MNPQWYVLRSKPTKEAPLWRELTARGYDCYYPQLHVRPVNPRSRKSRPYFPGYLFVHTEIEAVGTSTFQWMPFSSGFVAFDGTPATVPDTFIDTLRQHVDAINAAESDQVAGLKPGDSIKIQGGPFDGYEAIFDTRLAGTERVRVFLQLLRAKHLQIELPASQIRRRKSS